ncbi:uncharacterized protein B0H18DRAFT_1113203 [Fomitopsis serialis]|uniref:uncharacterized protein n=1 Tax=Fomitopsis serialis TaxID=139415 RepID=UPI002007CAA6|nr:uncharacterized protein B0H18DRAFT_1113203 [Neoantrodia serialis]KAH9937353.1 hypothetical protein B0H18DRAFT_1113203 [Neoantrodia serialis]
MASPADTNGASPSHTKRPLQRNSSKLGRSLSYISSALSLGSSSNMSSTRRRANTKLTPFERFMQLGRRNSDGTTQFPPPHWTDSADAASSSTSQADAPAVEGNIGVATDAPVRSGSPETILIEREDLLATPTTAEPQAVADVPEESPEAEGEDGHADSEPAPEPSYLARKIQALLATLPIPSQPQTPAVETVPSSQADPAHLPKLPLPAWIADSRLMSYITSPQVMNGSAAKDRASVWDMLDRLKSTTGMSRSTSSADKGKAPAGPADGVASAPPPDDSSEVEIARSEVISMFSDQTTIHEHEPETKEEKTLRERLAHMWPADGMRIGGHRLPTEQPTERRIWVPSKDKISLEIRWWGYRIYLPPPVLGVLDNKRMESTKRAALLTTALKWLLDHIPMAAIPIQMRPAMPLFKRIIPYMGYIGAFVAWSWDAIRAFDKGNGVTLTATWLLTFALVPGTWDDDMFPEVAPPAPASGNPPIGTPGATSQKA